MMSRGPDPSKDEIAAYPAPTLPPAVPLVCPNPSRCKADAEVVAALGLLAGGTWASQAAVVDAGGIQALVSLVYEGDDKADNVVMKSSTANALGLLATGDAVVQAAVVHAGGVEALVSIAAEGSHAANAEVATALGRLAAGSEASQDAVVDRGGVEVLETFVLQVIGPTKEGCGASSALRRLEPARLRAQSSRSGSDSEVEAGSPWPRREARLTQEMQRLPERMWGLSEVIRVVLCGVRQIRKASWLVVVMLAFLFFQRRR